MILSHRRPEYIVLITAALLWGCGAPPATPSSTQVPGPASPAASPARATATPAAAAIQSGGPIEPGAPDGEGSQDTDPPGLDVDPLLNTVVVTVSDRIRVRSEPRVSADSIKYEPVLPLRTELLVLDGPVSASGYTWYQVAPVSFDSLDGPGYGWVALAGTDGEPWIATCPPRPDLAALASMVGRLGLACYGNHGMTLTARLAHGEGLVCHNDLAPLPWWVEPDWLDDCRSFKVFLSPLEGEPNDDFWVKLGPAIDRETLPPDYDSGTLIWTAVEVTGRYDHPEARTCRGKSVPDGEQPPTPEAVVGYCRGQFVVTSISYPPPLPTPTPFVAPTERLLLTHFGSGNCEGGALAGTGVPGDGFAVIGPTSTGDLMAQVFLRDGLPNTKYVVQLIQSAGLGGSVTDCFAEDATLITDSRGDGHARVREAVLPATIGVFVYVYHLQDATGPTDIHWTRLIAVGSAP